jgi:hypothetical protein
MAVMLLRTQVEGTTVDAMLKGLFGEEDRNRAQDFVQRYETGEPSEGISGDECYEYYQRVTHRMSPDQYQQAAEQALGRMSSAQRSQFAEMLQQQMGGNIRIDQTDNSRQLAETLMQYRQQEQGGLATLFSGGDGGGGGGVSGMLDNPIVKATLGGIAATGMRQMMGRLPGNDDTNPRLD